MIRLLVVDDNETMRFGLAALMANEADITVIGQAADGRSAVAMAVADPPDVVLMDLSMPVLDGVAATREIVRDAPGVKILVFTSYFGQAKRQEALSAGAHGYLLKGSPPAALLQAIRAVAPGKSPMAPGAPEDWPPRREPPALGLGFDWLKLRWHGLSGGARVAVGS